MFKICGPTYRYRNEVLTTPELILVQDHHYDDQNQCHHLKHLLSASPVRHTVVFDHVLAHDEQYSADCVYFPILLAREATEFDQQNIITNWANKHYCFNFMINKLRPHRKLLLEVINNLNLDSYRHSLCWLTSPVPNIPVTDYRLGQEVITDFSVKNGRYLNAQTYQCLLQKLVFEPTAVSIITEPCYYERDTIITEKTLMAIYGGTIPIWFGGWRIPDYMRSVGFDVFDDLVDHSYQSIPDPEQRCRESVNRNIHLLKNLTIVDRSRLQHNLDLVKSNLWQKQVNSLIETYPDLRTI